MQLQRPDLLRQQAYINGTWQSAQGERKFAVLNPYDQSLLAEVADLRGPETETAIAAAHAAFPDWSSRTANSRSRMLRRWFELQRKHRDDLAMILTSEQGKPLKEARGEIAYGASFVEWFAEEAKRVYGDVIPAHQADRRLLAIKQPVGVVGAITPWNFPNAMITRKVAPALAAGCTVVIKPAEDTPLSALALAVLAEEAGFPPGVINIVPTASASEVGEVMTASPLIKKFSFTGSTKVGKMLIKQCADTVKKVSMELGGNAPFIVFEDAYIDAAVDGAIASKYRNAGQTCICSNRFYVQEAIYDTFVEKFTAATRQLNVGNGLDSETDIGPLINTAGRNKVQRLLTDAVEKGAQVKCGGGTPDENGTLFEPTVLSEAQPNMDLHREEIFGPIAPVYRFSTEEEVIQLANHTEYGLAAYFYGQNHARIWRVAEALQYGMVGINTGSISTAAAPFGGIKESGFGREGSKYGIEEFLYVKYLCWGGV
ncbi:MAG: NAD-dependent succinate-semialdehyde dehydrogenase [Bacteroidota bacterium]